MVKGWRRSGLSAEVQAGHFAIVSDVDEKLGGKDDGPNPHELLEAALAACTIITLQMYASRKQINLESADVVVKVESEGADESTISRQISLRGDLSEEQRQSLLAIANKCPIHKLLLSRITIETKLS